MITIRDERPSDVTAIRAVTTAAFADVRQSRQTEAAIIDVLRTAGALTLSLVAVDADDEIVGHVAVSPVTIDGAADVDWYGGGPLSVRPSRQRDGIGTALVGAAFERLRDIGARGCVLVGDPDYYRRFGFTSASSLVMPGVPPENVLALALDDEVPAGMVAFHPAFAAAEDDTPE
ncbi:GNAT family N-acetyltransferase [Mycobacterium antarcticum]|uniref:GNAT family N-acetyltransferase n=1 Tax=Mycolicibacterium sp. TUM20985 TaxID=3023370 RepID=UPI0025732490|nr:N-acetyltransferase [Mycolicibacterium sp. TUM20985]BDX32419.1 GNAT family N-acetyltransferase [Mycolicibacterium sp. TUM20985]